MPEDLNKHDGTMSFLEHLDELRSRLFRCLVAFLIAFAICWSVSSLLLKLLVEPIREQLSDGGEIVFIHITEPFTIYVKASAVGAIFLGFPFYLYQLWAFTAPGLYRRERRMVIPFVFFGTMFFVAGGLFGYSVATPIAARWLLNLGKEFTANLTLRSAFQFQTSLILGMGAVFELPVLIALFARMGLVTPGFLLRNLRTAVLIIAILAAVLTPTGDIMTMSIFAGPMIALYMLGVAVAWLFANRSSPEG